MAPRSQASSAKGPMATESFFVQGSGLLGLAIRSSQSTEGPARCGTLPNGDAARRRSCTASARPLRAPLHDARARPLRHTWNKVEMLFGLLVFAAIVGAVFAFVGVYNRLVAASERATRAWNDLDALLRQRHDEIPKLLEACEPHLRNERAVLDRVLEARAVVFAARQTRDADALGRAEADLRAAATAL